VLGLGERSMHKTYYPELRARLEELERFRALLDCSTDAFFLLEADSGTVLDCNQAAVQMLRTDSHRLLRTPLERFLRGERWQELVARATESRAEGRPFERDFTPRKGAPIPVELTVDHHRLGDTAYAIVVARDISGRRQAERERARLEEQLRQAQKMEAVGRLAGGVAHDFNNLLTALIGHAELIRAELRPDDPLIPEIDEIRQVGERAAELTGQLLTFSRKQVISPRVVEPGAALERAQKMLARIIGEQIELCFASNAAGRIKIDPAQLDQILVNLAINARDAMPSGGTLRFETRDVSFEGRPMVVDGETVQITGDYIVLEVADSGCGMDEATAARVFEPFFSTKRSVHGTGLGLATVYGIVRQNGGFIDLATAPGEGTTFSIFFPRVVESADPLREVDGVVDLGVGEETILLVEDDANVRRVAQHMLARQGYTVLVAEDGEHALRLAEAHQGQIQLLLTDVIMPRMNGHELWCTLRAQDPQLRVLYMSGHTDDVISCEGVLDEGVLFIQKPFSLSRLTSKVREALDS
jgi:two-component system cell cycle sensor histidine kinase/response regulator CckA